MSYIDELIADMKEKGCEVCGEPANCRTSNYKVEPTYVTDKAGQKWQTLSVHSTHYFCETHDRPCVRYRDGVPEGK